MSEPPAKPKKILVIDDGATVLAWTSRVLMSAGFDVATRDQPIGTGAAIVREQPDLVLIDVEMPTLRGDELVTGLKTHAAGRRMPIVLHSNLPLNELETRAQACGADGYIQKTPNEKEFLRQVTALITRQPASGEEPRKESRAVALAFVSSALQSLVKLVLAESPELSLVWARDEADAASLVASSKPFVLVVLDLVAGQRLEDAQVLAGLKTAGVTPVILFGPPADTETLAAANRAGVTHYLPLPAAAHALREAVREALHGPDVAAPGGAAARNGPRLRTPVGIEFTAADTTFSCSTWDICELGAFLCTDRQVKPGSRARLRIRVPGSSSPVTIACQVVHQRPEPVRLFPQGIGVSFEAAIASEREQLAAALGLR